MLGGRSASTSVVMGEPLKPSLYQSSLQAYRYVVSCVFCKWENFPWKHVNVHTDTSKQETDQYPLVNVTTSMICSTWSIECVVTTLSQRITYSWLWNKDPEKDSETGSWRQGFLTRVVTWQQVWILAEKEDASFGKFIKLACNKGLVHWQQSHVLFANVVNWQTIGLANCCHFWLQRSSTFEFSWDLESNDLVETGIMRNDMC